MNRKQLLDHVSTALPSLTDYYNDQGEYVEAEGDILAAYVAQALILNYDTAPDLEDENILSYLSGFLGQAITDLMIVCKALETGDSTR
jgi:hypothetical protein